MHGSFEKRVTCNLKRPDYLRLKVAAGAVGLSLAPYIREAALAHLDERFLVPPRLDDLIGRLIAETRRVGNNVNQVAARVNAKHSVTHEDLRQVIATVENLEDASRILRVVIQNLRHDHQVSESQDS